MSSANFGVEIKLDFDRGFAQKITQRMRNALFEWGEIDLKAAAVEKSPVQQDGGFNRASIQFILLERVSNPNDIVGQLQTESGYGGWLEIGTGLYGPHKSRVVPVHAKFLSWIDRETGERVFALSTQGMAAQPYMYPALVETAPRLLDRMRESTRRS